MSESISEAEKIFFISYLYLYSVQCLHVLQDSKHYMTHSTVQVQPNSQITDIPLTERQRLKDDHYQRPSGSLTCHWGQ